MLESKLIAKIKPQYVNEIPKKISGKVGKIIEVIDKRKVSNKLIGIFELDHLLERKVSELSGGELQRLACLVTIC